MRGGYAILSPVAVFILSLVSVYVRFCHPCCLLLTSIYGNFSGSPRPQCLAACRPERDRISPRSWWTMEKAFRTVSLRLEAKTELLGSVDHKLGVVVDEASFDWRHCA